MLFPHRLDLAAPIGDGDFERFLTSWRELADDECHHSPIWESPFVSLLRDPQTPAATKLQLCAVWSVNMVHGSYCFPRYVAALAARAEADVVRHGLLENAWDESGGTHHRSRSHFWLAVRLAGTLGISEADLERVVPLPAAQAYMAEHFTVCSQGDFEEALGMVSLIEEFTTPEFTLLFRGLLQSYEARGDGSAADFVLNGGAEYFTANISDDERHRKEMPRLVAEAMRSRGVDIGSASVAGDLRRVRRGMARSIELRAAFFAGIHDFVVNGGTHLALLHPAPSNPSGA